MNVLVWSSYVAHPVGGQERTSLEIALQLHQRGHHVVLVGAYDNAPELRAKIPATMPYYFFDMHRRRVKPHFAAKRLLRRVMEQHHIQIVSAHGSVFAPCMQFVAPERSRWSGPFMEPDPVHPAS